MIDLHCHILPGVDDGAATVMESCEMARLAVASGVTDVAVTPHCNVVRRFENYAGAELEWQINQLRWQFMEEDIPLRLHSGMEVFATPDLPELLAQQRLLTLGGSRYLLLEFAFGESPWFMEQMLEAVEAHGLVPVIAHPERYHCIQREPGQLFRWVQQERVVQVNKGSFFGMFGRSAARVAHWCLDHGCLHLIGSDAHSPYRRTTRLSDIYEVISDRTEPEMAAFLLEENPGDMLADKPVEPALAVF